MYISRMPSSTERVDENTERNLRFRNKIKSSSHHLENEKLPYLHTAEQCLETKRKQARATRGTPGMMLTVMLWKRTQMQLSTRRGVNPHSTFYHRHKKLPETQLRLGVASESRVLAGWAHERSSVIMEVFSLAWSGWQFLQVFLPKELWASHPRFVRSTACKWCLTKNAHI